MERAPRVSTGRRYSILEELRELKKLLENKNYGDQPAVYELVNILIKKEKESERRFGLAMEGLHFWKAQHIDSCKRLMKLEDLKLGKSKRR